MAGKALPDLRLGYARTLIDLGRMQLALSQLQTLTQQSPEFASLVSSLILNATSH
jgi:predicted Zn-dependent protease